MHCSLLYCTVNIRYYNGSNLYVAASRGAHGKLEFIAHKSSTARIAIMYTAQ